LQVMSPNNLVTVNVISFLLRVNVSAKSPFFIPFHHLQRELPSIQKKCMDSDTTLTPPSSDSSSFLFPPEEYQNLSADPRSPNPRSPNPSPDPSIPPMPHAAAVPAGTAPATQAQSYRAGGVKTFGSKSTRFSGGGMHPRNCASRAKSSLAMRPNDDLWSYTCLEAASIEPLEEAKRIDEGPSSPVAFSTWINDIKIHMTYHGMDSVAYVLVPTTPSIPLLISTTILLPCRNPPNGISSPSGAASHKNKSSHSIN
jgi:hypothetical protein